MLDYTTDFMNICVQSVERLVTSDIALAILGMCSVAYIIYILKTLTN